MKERTSNHMGGSSGNQPPSWKGHFINTDSGTVESGLLSITRDAPLSPITQEIPRFLGALCQKLGI